MSADVETREYKDAKEFDRAAKRMAKEGWVIQSHSERTQRAGCLRILLTGGFALVFPPKPTIVVTYRRSGG